MFGAKEAFKGQAVLGFSCESPSSGSLNHGWVLKGSAKCLHILISNEYLGTTTPNVGFKIGIVSRALPLLIVWVLGGISAP